MEQYNRMKIETGVTLEQAGWLSAWALNQVQEIFGLPKDMNLSVLLSLVKYRNDVGIQSGVDVGVNDVANAVNHFGHMTPPELMVALGVNPVNERGMKRAVIEAARAGMIGLGDGMLSEKMK